MFLSYFEWNEAKEGSVFYILFQYFIFIPDIRSSADQVRHSVFKQTFITSLASEIARSSSLKRPMAIFLPTIIWLVVLRGKHILLGFEKSPLIYFYFLSMTI